MIWSIAFIVGLVTATYYVNACKIRLVTEGRALVSAALEGVQGFLFVFALIRLIDLTSSAAGAAAYVVGAFAGTAAAVRASGRRPAASVCCTQSVGDPTESSAA